MSKLLGVLLVEHADQKRFSNEHMSVWFSMSVNSRNVAFGHLVHECYAISEMLDCFDNNGIQWLEKQNYWQNAKFEIKRKKEKGKGNGEVPGGTWISYSAAFLFVFCSDVLRTISLNKACLLESKLFSYKL